MENTRNTISVLTSDDVNFEVEVDFLCHSLQLKRMLEIHPDVDEEFRVMDDAKPLKLRKTNSEVFRAILEWIKRHHKERPLIVPQMQLISDELEHEYNRIKELANVPKPTDVCVEQPNALPLSSDPVYNQRIQSISATIDDLKAVSFSVLPQNFCSQHGIKQLLERVKNKDKILNSSPLTSDKNRLDLYTKKYATMKKALNKSGGSPFFPPLIPTWDFEFFEGLPKAVLFQLIVTSKSLAIYQLNRNASVYVAQVMGDTPEKMAKYFSLKT